MDKQKRYLLYGSAAAVLLIALIIAGAAYGRRGNDGSAPSEEAQTQSTQEAQTEPAQETQGGQEAEDPLLLYQREQDVIMTQMMADMDVDASGSASLSFLKGMLPHHESAVAMAESYLKYGGTNDELKQLAETIIKDQTEEIEQMNRLIQELGEAGDSGEDEEGYLEAYSRMMSQHQHMHHGPSAAADVEQAFAEGMMMHHQMAVDMAKDILNYTKNEEVRSLAEAMIEAQEREIVQMQKIAAPSGH